MSRRRSYPRKRPARRQTRENRRPHIKPGADPLLKRVFSDIGKPEQQPFTPDPFQLAAVDAIQQTDCLVTAPTGAGKTWIAEQAIARVVDSGGRAWYASPLKALTNAKYREFSDRFGAPMVGILTGDRKENAQAPIITGTTEILRNQLYDAMHRGETLNTELVIIDEAHFLGDPDRGVVWEEIMIYLPSRVPLLLLSATIGNAREIADWLESLRRRECRVVHEAGRPVPLWPLFFHPSGTLMPLMVQGKPGKRSRLYKKVAAYLSNRRPQFMAPPRQLPPFDDMLRVLRKFHLLPAIFFLKSRADCDRALGLCVSERELPLNRQQRIADRIDELAESSPHTREHRHRRYAERYGVGAHHSGQLPTWKLVLETLMTEGLLEAVFATSTVAAGVNFPARTVLFLNSDRFNGTEFLPLTPTEFHQMTGRAGRRGMDRVGFAVAIPGRFMDLRETARLVNATPSDVNSQIRIDFSMVLNLLLSHTPDQIRELLQHSFAAFQMAASGEKHRKNPPGRDPGAHLIDDFTRHLQFLVRHEYVTPDGTLTEDGIWASHLRVDLPLIIAESIRREALPLEDPILMAAVMAVFVNERESDDVLQRSVMPKKLRQALNRLKTDLLPFVEDMMRWKFPLRPMFRRPAATLYAWSSGRSWEFTREVSEMEDGNLVMLMLRTVDNLRHVRALKSVFPTAAQTADAAIDLIMREPVVMDDLF